MSENERHQMILVDNHASGAEEWSCPDCGRHLVMTWPPDYRKVVLEPGNEYAEHVGVKGDMQIGSTHIIEVEDHILSDELRAALDELDLDSLFDAAD